MTREEEIEIVHGKGGHAVILGAGASYALTLRNTEKNGKSIPLMKNIIEVVGLNNVVSSLPQDYKILKEDFEKLYSKLSNSGLFKDELAIIERRVHRYFSELELPEEPTIYDYLVLSLRRGKDFIATFNWDPFLYKAYLRNADFVEPPSILFLHGCVSIGYDKTNGSSGLAGWTSYETNQIFEPTKLLYPVDQKDYNSDEYIKGQWDAMARQLKESKRVTVFGYSAPKSDVEAINLLQNAWGTPKERAMEEFELIDVREEQEVRKSWDTFIHSHHYQYSNDYFGSSLANHPRRSVESYRHWAMPRKPSDSFQDGNKIPENFDSLEQLWEWHKPLIDAENNR
jgi:hypothetical protein